MRRTLNPARLTGRVALPGQRLIGLLTLVLLFALWELAGRAGWVDPVVFPPPTHVWRYLVETDFSTGIGFRRIGMGETILASLLRVSAGLVIAFVIAFSLGGLLVSSRILAAIVEPLVRLLAPIAPIAWIPLGLALFGVGDSAAVFLVFMGVVFILTIATTAAIRDVPADYLKSAITMGATRVQLWRHVIAPYILPQVFLLMRMNFFAAWMAVLAAEMVGLRSGLGAMIMVGRESANMRLVIFGMVLIGLSGFAVDVLLSAVQRRYLWWGSQPPWR